MGIDIDHVSTVELHRVSVINNKWGYELVHMFIVWQPVAVEWRRGDTVRHAAMVVGTLAWMVGATHGCGHTGLDGHGCGHTGLDGRCDL